MILRRLMQQSWVFWMVLAGPGASSLALGQAVVVSDNLDEPTGGTELIQPGRQVAAVFACDEQPRVLALATLLMSDAGQNGMATLSLYSDAGLEPDYLLGELTAPAEFPSTLEPVVFSSRGLVLEAGTAYWLVIEATGEMEWAWSNTNVGGGVGFMDAWGVAPESPGEWWSVDAFPVQMQVAVTANLPGDIDKDGHIDLADFAVFAACMTGPGQDYDPNDLPTGCTAPVVGGRLEIDYDGDMDVDLSDYRSFLSCYTGSETFVDADCVP